MSKKVRSDDQVEFEDCTVVGESASGLALLIVISGRREWIPKSCIHDDSECYEVGHQGTLVIPESLAVEKRLV